MASRGREPVTLLVDDDQELLELNERRLDSDYAIRTATTARDGLEAMSQSIDAVLLDRDLPDCSGDALIETLREREYDQPIGVISGFDRGSRPLEPDVDVYLTKPVSKAELIDAIESMLSDPAVVA